MTDFLDEFNLDLNKIKNNTITHEELLQKHLQDKDYQRIYLETSLEEFATDGNVDAFMSSVQNVLQARNQSEITEDIGVSLTDIISGKVQLEFNTAFKLIHKLGYKIQLKTT